MKSAGGIDGEGHLAKKGRPLISLQEKNPEAFALHSTITGGLDAIRRVLKDRVTDVDLRNSVKDTVEKVKGEVRQALHQDLLHRRAVREKQVHEEREKLRATNDAIPFTSNQSELLGEMQNMDSKQLLAARAFHYAALANIQFLLISSRKANPHFENEELIIKTFDDIEEAITQRTFTVPSRAPRRAQPAPQSQGEFPQFVYEHDDVVGGSVNGDSVAGTDTTDIH